MKDFQEIDVMSLFGAINNAYKTAHETGTPQEVRLSDYAKTDENEKGE